MSWVPLLYDFVQSDHLLTITFLFISSNFSRKMPHRLLDSVNHINICQLSYCLHKSDLFPCLSKWPFKLQNVYIKRSLQRKTMSVMINPRMPNLSMLDTAWIPCKSNIYRAGLTSIAPVLEARLPILNYNVSNYKVFVTNLITVGYVANCYDLLQQESHRTLENRDRKSVV